ncbi:hypothetical protein PIIN_09634 [Serendipita indica DSM 11827]|uniref:CxC2-like cysteine cluster KDZ transposase-associated domain-containing protein n=1 Tax=Serendipita indica (strain DSM 11827) TaxID=1109443 RepID=G4TWF0_SERID|nr:hypothetical protein PIIN_09634 [Serendipita indica DSM 11827]
MDMRSSSNEQNPQSDSTSVMWNGFRIFNDSKFFSYLNNTHNKEIYAFWKLVLAGHKWELVYAHFHSLYVDVPDEAAQRLKASLQAVEHRIWRDAIETARMYCMETAAQGRMRCIRHHVTNYKYLGEPETWVEQMENSSFEDKVALILSARRFNLDGQVNTMLKEHARAQYQAGSTALSEFNVSEGNHFALKEYQCEPDPIMEPKWDALKDWDAADRRDVGNAFTLREKQQHKYFGPNIDTRMGKRIRPAVEQISTSASVSISNVQVRQPKKRKRNTENYVTSWDPAPSDDYIPWEPVIPQESAKLQPFEPLQATRRSKTQHDFLDEWINCSGLYLSALLELESLPYGPIPCACNSGEKGLFMCTNCFTTPRCSQCIVISHLQTPFHKIKRWNGTHLQGSSLSDLGLVVQLGHRGYPCPMPAGARKLLVLHIDGFHALSVSLCGCDSSTTPDLQLFKSRMFSASIQNPKTAFTFDLLEHFRILNLESKGSANSYLSSLYRLTDLEGLSNIADRVREFRRISRQWSYLVAQRDSGSYETSQNTVYPLIRCLECPACPQPGVNILENWAETMPNDRHHRTVQITGLLSTHLEVDSIDLRSLALLAVYFNSDFAISQIIHRMSGIKDLVLTYDIACQYRRNFQTRFNNLAAFLRLPPHLRIIFLVPKFHLPAHKEECRYRYSLNYCKKVGRTDGEAIERLWSALNHLSGSTSRMTPGGRMDNLNFHLNYWNWRKTCKMGERVTVLQNTREMLIQHQTLLADLRASIGEAKAAEWSELEDHYNIDQEGRSIYQTLADQAPTRAEIIQKLTRFDALLPPLALENADGYPALAFWVNDGLDLEEYQKRLEIHSQSITTERQRIELNQKRVALADRINDWKARTPLDIHDEEDEEDDPALPEQWKLPIPSTLPRNEQLALPRQVEKELREAQAFDYLRALRTGLAEEIALLRDRDRHQHGYDANLRSRSLIERVRRDINFNTGRYRATFAALEVLGGARNPELKPLLPADVSAANVFRYTQELGRGFNVNISWIWRRTAVGTHANDDNWLDEMLRVRYLEAKASHDRWSEELELTHAEITYTHKTFEFRCEEWLQRALNSEKQGERAHAYAMSSIYRRLADEITVIQV